MLGFFRINDPYRLIILFLAMLFLRLPYFVTADPLVAELNWMLIGEQINEGNVLYRDFIEPIAPLAAWVYAFITLIFGKTIIIYQILALLLVTYQFSLFNNIMFKNKAYNESSYIPAFVYALIMHAFFDFFTLSPALISLTFILLVLDNIYLRIENKLDDSIILKTGFFMGMAMLFYLPSIVFLLATIISFLFLTSLVFRRYVLFAYGFFIPIFFVGLYYFWKGALAEMLFQWVDYTIFTNTESLLDTSSILLIIALPTLVFILSLYKTFVQGRYTNYQLRVQQVMFIMFLGAWLSWLISQERAAYQLLLFVPALAFFITHLLLQFKRKRNAEIFIWIFSFLIIGMTYALHFKNAKLHMLGNFNTLNPTASVYSSYLEGHSAMILGGQKNMYVSAGNVASRFYHPELSERILAKKEDADLLIAIFEDIDKNQPEVIIDLNGYFGTAYHQTPVLRGKYRAVAATIYVLRE